MQFAAGVARVYRTSAPAEQVFSFYEERLDARPEAWAEMMRGGSAPAAGSSGSMSYSVELYEKGEERAGPQLEVRRSMREARLDARGSGGLPAAAEDP